MSRGHSAAVLVIALTIVAVAQMRRYAEALADAEGAKRTLMSTDVCTLAGLIRLRRGELRDARSEFDQAIDRDAENCAARMDHGFVDAAVAEPGPASEFFATAFDSFKKATEALRHRAQSADVAVIAMQQRDVEESVHEEADAALDAALAFARHGTSRSRSSMEKPRSRMTPLVNGRAQLLADLKARQN